MDEPKKLTEVFSLHLPTCKAAAFEKLAATHGREPAEQLEFLVIEALIGAGLLPQDEVDVHRLRESLICRFLEKAEEVYAETLQPDITAETARQLMCDTDWKRDYEKYKDLRDVNTIHPTFGRGVKLRLNLRTGKV